MTARSGPAAYADWLEAQGVNPADDHRLDPEEAFLAGHTAGLSGHRARLKCPGCHRVSDRDGMCRYCREAAAALRRKDFDPAATLRTIRMLCERYVIDGLPPRAVDQLVGLVSDMDRQLAAGEPLPAQWVPAAGPVTETVPVSTKLL